MIAYVDSVLEQARAADQRAARAQAAYLAGPEAFLSYLDAQAAEARKRIDETHGETKPTPDPA